jgi:hypothetical protein
MIGAVSFTVDRKRAGAANSFPAIRVERDGFLAGSEQIFIKNIEHFEKRCVRGNVPHLVIDEFAAGLAILLPPNFKFEVHITRCKRTGRGARA